MDWKTIVLAVARHFLGAAATWLVAHGALSADPSATEQFIGAVTFLGTIAWSLWDKKGRALMLAELARWRAMRQPVQQPIKP